MSYHYSMPRGGVPCVCSKNSDERIDRDVGRRSHRGAFSAFLGGIEVMSTIALYTTEINRMPTLFQNLKHSVIGYQAEMASLKANILTIPNSICNMEDIISSIQASTQTQEQKAESIDLFDRSNEEFVHDVIAIDSKVSDIVNQRKEDFYATYAYLKPECEKNWTDKAGDWFVSAGEWCREQWYKAVANAINGIALEMSLLINARFFIDGFIVSVLKNVIEIPMVSLYPFVLLDKLLGGQGIMSQSLSLYDEAVERFLMRNKWYERNVPAFNMGRCIGDIVSILADFAGTVYGAYIVAWGIIGGAGGTAVGGPIALAVAWVAVGVGALIAVGGILLSAQASANLKKDLAEYWESRLNESRSSTGTEGGSRSAQGLTGRDFENYLNDTLGGDGSFSVGGREFDGGVGNRWWEAKSGNYWDMLEDNPSMLAKFKSDMGNRLRIATDNGATYELFSNTPIPESIKQWLIEKGIPFTELLD